jgi:hypothetical protein
MAAGSRRMIDSSEREYNPLKDKEKLLHNNPMQFTMLQNLDQLSWHLMIISRTWRSCLL